MQGVVGSAGEALLVEYLPRPVTPITTVVSLRNNVTGGCGGTIMLRGRSQTSKLDATTTEDDVSDAVAIASGDLGPPQGALCAAFVRSTAVWVLGRLTGCAVGDNVSLLCLDT